MTTPTPILTVYRQYQDAAVRTEKDLSGIERLNHALLGIISEKGELAGSIKKLVIFNRTLDDEVKGQVIRANLIEEIGDVCWHLAIIFNAHGVEMESAGGILKSSARRRSCDDADVLKSTLFAFEVASGELVRISAETHPDLNDKRPIYFAREILSLLEIMAKEIGQSMKDVLNHNIEKLQKRYKDGYSNQAAADRADKGGLSDKES